MSAFVVSDKHINTLVSYAQRAQLKMVVDDDQPYEDDNILDATLHAQRMADILRAENVRSVNYRYDENYPAEPIMFQPELLPDKWQVFILKACDCYDYQACETPDYRSTLAARIVSYLRSSAIGNLPGYELAPAWDIN